LPTRRWSHVRPVLPAWALGMPAGGEQTEKWRQPGIVVRGGGQEGGTSSGSGAGTFSPRWGNRREAGRCQEASWHSSAGPVGRTPCSTVLNHLDAGLGWSRPLKQAESLAAPLHPLGIPSLWSSWRRPVHPRPADAGLGADRACGRAGQGLLRFGSVRPARPAWPVPPRPGRRSRDLP
jgi:hypothetical protein